MIIGLHYDDPPPSHGQQLPLVARQLPTTNHNIGMTLSSIVSFHYTVHTQQVTRKKKMKILDICLLILSVSLLCVLVTTAPAAQNDDSSTVDKAVVTKNDTTLKNSTTTAKNETSVATPTNATTTNTTTVSNDTQETTPISQAEKEKYTIEPSRSTKREEKPKPKSAKFLLYELEKDIRNLSLDNVNYIIDMGNDVLAYSLLDKLGYREGDIENDPHLKVIEDNNPKLVAKLKRACVKYNIQYAYARMRYFRESRSMRAEYKRGVVRPEVLGHAHKYGGQIQTQSKAIYIDRVSALHITQARPNTIFG